MKKTAWYSSYPAMVELVRMVPEWKDEERYKRERNWIVAYLLGCGFPYRDIVEIKDPKMVLAAYKALRYCLTEQFR